MSFWDKLKCFIGIHDWSKYGGPTNAGNGKFRQGYICDRCSKIKYFID